MLLEKPIYIRENLTPKGNKLFKEARDFRKQFNFQFVWTKNGFIFLPRNETEKIIFVNDEDTIYSLKSQSEYLNSKN
jgi:aspartate/tyrosine/aromatic aminotransferase